MHACRQTANFSLLAVTDPMDLDDVTFMFPQKSENGWKTTNLGFQLMR
jgi:hypothetical protein